jgi:hypothetical protein
MIQYFMLLIKKSICFLSLLFSVGLCASEEIQVVGSFHGNLDLSAISCISEGHCLVASDELNALQPVSIKSGKLIAIDKKIVLGSYDHENDIEGLTHDGNHFFAVGSHGLSRKKNRYQKSRYKIFKIQTDLEGNLISLNKSSLESILSQSSILSQFYKKKLASNGINIEGLAFHEGQIFVGFRSPIINGKAQFISFDSKKFWNNEKDVDLKHYEVNLNDDRGIRSFEFKNNKLYIISGASEIESSDDSELFITSLDDLTLLESKQVPNSQFKLEGFDLLDCSRSIYIYDSQVDGLPTLGWSF